MVTVFVGGLVVFAVIGLGYYAVHNMRPAWFRLQTSMLRVFSFSLEIESSRRAEKPSSQVEQGLGPNTAKGGAQS
jgi:hypothetical protein